MSEREHMAACVAAIRDHLGGKPELVGEMRRALEICRVALRQPLDEWKGNHERKALDAIRAILSKTEEEAER